MNYKVLIVAMMLVTMIPRIIPLYAFKTENMPIYMKSFLGYIPFAVLGALILPGGLSGISGEYFISIISLMVAVLIAWYKGGIVIPITGAVLTAIILEKIL